MASPRFEDGYIRVDNIWICFQSRGTRKGKQYE